MKRAKYKSEIITNNLCIRRSSIFNNPKYKYNMFIYKKVLQEHGATNFRIGHYGGHFNQPTVLIFDNIKAKRVTQALSNLPEFHDWGCIVDEVTWDLSHAITYTED